MNERKFHCGRDFQSGATGRLVFRNLSQEGALMAKQLERDIEALREKLKGTKALDERAEIKDKIETLEDQRKKMGDLTARPLPSSDESLLLYGMGNKVGEISRRIEEEKIIEKRRELMDRKMKCLSVLEARRQPVGNDTELQAAADQIRDDTFLIDTLEQKGFDPIHLGFLMESDISAFLDDRLLDELSEARQKMITEGRVEAVLLRDDEKKVVDAEKEWAAFREDTERKIAELEAERDGLHGHGFESKEELERIEWIENYLPNLRDQLSARSVFTNRAVMKSEKEQTAKVLRAMTPELKDKTRKLLIEARQMRVAEVKEYFRKKIENLQRNFREKETLFDEGNRKDVDGILTTATAWLDEKLDTPEKVLELDHRLALAERHLKDSITGIEAVQKDRPGFEMTIRGQFAVIKQRIEAFTPARIQALATESPESAKAMQEMRAMKESGQMAEILRGFEADLGSLGTMEATELQAIAAELDTLHKKIGGIGDFEAQMENPPLNPSKMELADRAHRVIVALKNTTDVAAIRATLEANFAGHLQFIKSTKVFKKHYGAYTSGHMAFRQKGQKWTIIIDSEALGNPAMGVEFQKEITHELLHLEFENNVALKTSWVNLYTKSAAWPAIKAAFVNANPAKKPADYRGPDKKVYTADDWKDEDVISELYAMQNEIGGVVRPDEESGLNDLRKTLLNSGIAGTALGLGQEETQEIIRGYEGDPHAGVTNLLGGDENDNVQAKPQGSYESYNDKIKNLANSLEEMKKSEYIGYVPNAGELVNLMADYNQETARMNEEFRVTNNPVLDGEINQRVEKVKTDIDKVIMGLAKVGEDVPNKTMNPLRNIWNNTSFLAIADFVQAGKDVMEFLKRRHNRKKEDHAARLGKAVFGNTDIGYEFTARQQKAESEEVHEWQSRYEHLDAWDLIELIHHISNYADPNKDQVKAILRILADKGRIDWRDEHLWNVLNKMQGAVHLTPGDEVLLHNPPLLRQKLHTAIGNIWDYDEFMSLERKNVDSYDSGKKKYYSSLNAIQDQITVRMKQLLRMHKDGKKVDPQEYEACIEYSIENGKSYGEACMFYLMAGITSQLLPPDRAMVLDKHLNAWPATQWVYNQKPPLNRKDFAWYANRYFKDDLEKGEVGAQFRNFYWTVIQNDEMVVQRVRKAVSDRGWDHDWARHIAPMGEASSAERYLQFQSGQDKVQETSIENSMAGALMFLEENALAVDHIDYRKSFARQMGWIAMADGILDGIAYQKGSYTRTNSAIENAYPREGGVGRHPDWTVAKHRRKMKNFLSLFDRELFRMLRDTVAARQNAEGLFTQIKNHLLAHYPAERNKWNEMVTLDDVFKKIGFIIDTITSERYTTADQFKANVATLTQGLDALPAVSAGAAAPSGHH